MSLTSAWGGAGKGCVKVFPIFWRWATLSSTVSGPAHALSLLFGDDNGDRPAAYPANTVFCWQW